MKFKLRGNLKDIAYNKIVIYFWLITDKRTNKPTKDIKNKLNKQLEE